MNLIKNAWTQAEVKTLCDMWRAGKSCREIAAVLHRTTNSIIGKAHRCNLPTHITKYAQK